MKKLLLAFTALLSTTTAIAEGEHSQTDFCTDLSLGARFVMTARQEDRNDTERERKSKCHSSPLKLLE